MKVRLIVQHAWGEGTIQGTSRDAKIRYLFRAKHIRARIAIWECKWLSSGRCRELTHPGIAGIAQWYRVQSGLPRGNAEAPNA